MKRLSSFLACYLSILLSLLLLTGCGASFFASNTTATYETPDGKKITYSSDKEHTGLDAVYELYENGQVKKVHIKVDRAGTQESVVAATLQQSIMNAQLLESLMPLLKAAATKGAGATIP